ncbi:type II toxin-antitoxin system HigB family toxin [Algoriphagus sp. D3-2-R+10]|uniref:type II toxin-antitoxin system HigB family toxin n=1 Tax=Algoriphagus aurantiacus TaxID=3103948 RepID=UPI002B3FE615|nr:type II toxin-antitoxin system HigB family toxin [Algoriphagus sp. D3-2-R+10]MEB2776255.1 type II toxin-antitoxin system HigB family toxin [Algoriphagus sp. D3-2-R+10]
MRIISERTLVRFISKHPDSKAPLERWVKVVKSLKLNNLNEIKLFFGSADVLANNRVIFNIGGNKFRLIAGIHVASVGKQDIVYTIWIGTHADYNKIDANKV